MIQTFSYSFSIISRLTVTSILVPVVPRRTSTFFFPRYSTISPCIPTNVPETTIIFCPGANRSLLTSISAPSFSNIFKHVDLAVGDRCSFSFESYITNQSGSIDCIVIIAFIYMNENIGSDKRFFHPFQIGRSTDVFSALSADMLRIHCFCKPCKYLFFRPRFCICCVPVGVRLDFLSVICSKNVSELFRFSGLLQGCFSVGSDVTDT